MPTVLTIAGFDPSSGAGVTADLAVFTAHGLFGTSAITSLTVQSTLGVRSSHPVAPEVLKETLLYLDEDLPPAGIKIGMLATAAEVQVVSDYIAMVVQRHPTVPVVVDPILLSSSGRELLSKEGLEAVKSHLLPISTWTTPNIGELGVLSGHPVGSPSEVETAAWALQEKYPKLTILATGGHLDSPDDLVLPVNSQPQWLQGTRVLSNSTHGTGCALSSSLLCRLVLGDSPAAACRAAKDYVLNAIKYAEPIGHGIGPLNHRWPLSSSAE